MKKKISVDFNGYMIREFTLKKLENISKNQEKSFEINNAISQNDKDKNLYRVTLNVTTYTKLSKLDLTLDGFFKLSNEMDDNQKDYFLSVSGPSILYPYARAFISNVTGFDVDDTLLLPLINFDQID